MRKLTLSIMILIDSTPQHNFLAIFGDMNAKISCSRKKFACNKRTNRNGNKLFELVSEKSLYIVNSTFQKRLGKTSLVAKLFNRMILNRICPKIDPHLRCNQNGFRPSRSTTAQVLALRRIIEKVRNNHLPSVIVFIDFSKAFDSINHQVMFRILSAYIQHSTENG